MEMEEMILDLLERVGRIIPSVIMALEEPSHFPLEGNEDYGEMHIGLARAHAELLYQFEREARELAKRMDNG